MDTELTHSFIRSCLRFPSRPTIFRIYSSMFLRCSSFHYIVPCMAEWVISSKLTGLETGPLPSLKLTNKKPKVGLPNRKCHLPTIHFQWLCWFQGGYFSGKPSPKFNMNTIPLHSFTSSKYLKQDMCWKVISSRRTCSKVADLQPNLFRKISGSWVHGRIGEVVRLGPQKSHRFLE